MSSNDRSSCDHYDRALLRLCFAELSASKPLNFKIMDGTI